MQERQESDTIIHSIVHKDDTRFIINTHGFHNAGLLRKYLPVALTKPRPLFTDRRKRHDELATVLSVTQKEKRAATQEKAAATREKNKAAKAGETEAPPAQGSNTEGGGAPEASPARAPMEAAGVAGASPGQASDAGMAAPSDVPMGGESNEGRAGEGVPQKRARYSIET